MPEHKTLGPVVGLEPLGQTCPVCEAPLHRAVKHKTELPRQPRMTYIVCDWMAEQDFFGDAIMASERGFHASIREIWGDEVRYMMETRPDAFPPASVPRREHFKPGATRPAW
ncbi:MAG: hypothetical protein JO069_09020 [Verrucomicrobia bacterium]|nr:hypothetical protein [Verrucomicrobiota bacterium]